VQARLKVFQNNVLRLFHLLRSKAADVAVFVFKHPMKSIFYFVKLYFTIILFSLCLMVSISAFSQESVPAKATTTTDDIVTSPTSIAGTLLANAPSTYQTYLGSLGAFSSVSCWSIVEYPNPPRHVISCSYIRITTGNTEGVTNMTVQGTAGSGTTTYSCPPDGYADYTEKSGSGTNTVCSKPYVAPPLETVNCVAYAGADASYANVYSVGQKSQAELDSLQCANNLGDGGGEYANSCHLTGFAGWLENVSYDSNGSPDGYNYSPINGTISGFDCDAGGKPTSKDETCTAFDNGSIKSVTCPNGTSMSVPWSDFLAANDRLTNGQSTLTSKVTNLENTQVTTNDVVASLTADPAFMDSVKGEDGGDCLVTSVVQGEPQNYMVIQCGSQEPKTVFTGQRGLAGNVGATGADGADGADGGECTAIETAQGVSIICPDSTAFVAKGVNGQDGMAGADGEGCTTSDNGVDVVVTCGPTTSTLQGVDEVGIIAAIDNQTTELKSALTYQGELPSVTFSNSQALNTALGTPNDYQTRNYGTVIESAVNEMKLSPLFTSVDTFFDVSITGSCPTYSATVPFMNTSVTLDQWCQPVMTNIWPMIQSVVLIVFSYFGFREAVL
jgi:hypothetical protein